MKHTITITTQKPAHLANVARFGLAAKYFLLGFAACFLLIGSALSASLPEYIPTTKCTDEQIARYSDSSRQHPEFYNDEFYLINENCERDVK